MGPVRQNPIQRTVRSVHMCVHCTARLWSVKVAVTFISDFLLQLMSIVAHNIAQNRPLTLQTITIAPMMSI